MNIIFQPGGRRVHISESLSFIEAAARAGVLINTPCGGNGTCGKCRIRFEQNPPDPSPGALKCFDKKEIENGWRLACQTHLEQDAVVYIPQTSIFGGRHQIQTASDSERGRTVDARLSIAPVEMTAPTMQDDAPDLIRLEHALNANSGENRILSASLRLLRGLGGKLRKANFQGTAVLHGNRLIDFVSSEAEAPIYALAFDIGTTTLVGALLNTQTGEEVAIASAMNPQTAYGDDVLSRIAHTGKGEASLEELRSCILDAVQQMTRDVCQQAGVSPWQIGTAVFTGNTTMQHLLCGFDPASLGMVPFVPLYKRGIEMDSAAFGLELHPEALVYVFPVIGGFVGGDTIAGLLACEMQKLEGPVLMVDIGTNGEIVLLHEGRLHAASTAAGPAFEGARISCGMRAASGAIERVKAEADLCFSVIGDVEPAGLCGSGLIDLCGELIKIGALKQDGRLLLGDELPYSVPEKIRKRIRLNENGEPECLLHEANGKRVILTQRDVRELQLGAGAIRAGIQILLKQSGISASDLKQVLIAGGFGSFIRRDNAQRIGLIPPEVHHEKVRFTGNVAFSGAKWVAVSQQAQEQAEALALAVAHVELNQDPDFAMEFAMAMQFPGDGC